MPFAAILTADTALPYCSLAVTGYTFCYLGHAHAIYDGKGHALSC